MAGKAAAKPVGWGDAPPTPSIEDRLAALEGGTGQLTVQELIGVRALLERAGFDCDKGSFDAKALPADVPDAAPKA